MHALFPISLDNTTFTTEETVNALTAGLREFEKITFLVADRIQVYNDLAKVLDDPSRMSTLDWSGNYRKDLSERTRWLTKIRRRLHDWPIKQHWNIIGFSDLCDGSAFESFRLIWLLYQADPDFRADIDIASENFVNERAFNEEHREATKRLSIAYLLEEIAINIRLKLGREIYSEFYLGRTLNVLLKLYAGKYLKSVEDLARRRNRRAHDFRFFDWTGSTWISSTDRPIGARSSPIRIIKNA